ncbi:MAG TPA: PBP1A family penicillin-binding protein [Candidatus Udaeobacter sp.]|nr:PBP1A family penicillin-binding protein [Candidatus Udaeobacter sp.]
MKPTKTYLKPPPGYRFRRPWYLRPWFYIPVAILAVMALFMTVFFSSVVVDLQAQAKSFDLTKLDQMESASVILDRNGKIFGQIYVENRETVPYEKLAPDLINAVIAVEDAKFYEHHGYDLFGIIRAALKNLMAGHVRQGASTITQQLARNSFSLKERTYRRKLLEIFLAKRIEENFSKQKILELYLNRIYFGGGMYGAEAAARGYFGKSARDMTLAECATLAGLIKSPNRLSPWSDRTSSRETRDFALDRMRDNGFITHEQCVAARAEKIAVGSRQNAQGQTYAVDYIRQQVIAAVGWDRAINEGYRIHTTIDVDLQRVAEDSLKAHLEQVEKHPDYNHQTYADYAASFRKAKSSGKMAEQPAPEYLQGAVIGLDNASGDILVLVGGRDFEHNQFNRALQARRPAGTAMLPFVYASAFERGMYPGSVVEDSPLDNRAVMIGGTTGILGEWGPENADNHYEGRMTARQALVKSKNGATVRIGMDAGIDAVLQLCSSAGIRSQLRPYPATFLGSSEVTLAELAMGYTIFPNGGWRPSTPHILERIEEKDGTVVWNGKQQSIRKIVTKPETAYEVHSCLADALQSGTGKAAYTQFGLKKFPAAGKTGTAYDFTDALFAGYDSSFTCAVWAGFDKPQKIYRGAFGRELALPIWVDIMNAAAQSYPPREIKQPSSLKQIEICSRSGLLATDKCYDAVKSDTGDTVQRRSTYMEIATQAQAPTEVCNIHGEPRARLAREFGSSDLPRAELAVNVREVMPVAIKSPTLIADHDPYDSLKATAIPDAPPQPAVETAEAQKTDTANGTNEMKAASNNASLTTQSAPEIRKAVPVQTIPKAIPVQPQERQPSEIRRAIPVKPLDQEDTQRTLLRSAVQPPGDLHE